MTTTKAILKTLDTVKPYLLPEETLHNDVETLTGRRLGWTQFRQDLERAEASQFIVGLPDGDQPGRFKYRITETGQAELLA